MTVKNKTAAIGFMVAASVSSSAYAQCTIPHSISNGEVADATEVMENFEAVADCADQAVTATGAPEAGQIAVVTGAQSVTGGDLSGDVTTSGTTQATLIDTGVVAGTYTNPSLVVDAKGRIISAANGGSGSGGSTDWTEFTLTNPGGETGDGTGWTMVGGGFDIKVANANMTPREGTYAFEATPNSNPQMYQSVDLTTYATGIDGGNVFVRAEVLAGDTWTDGEMPWIFIIFYDAADNQISRIYSARQMQTIGKDVWRLIAAEGHVPPNARSMRIYLRAERLVGTNNNLAFDAVRAFIKGF